MSAWTDADLALLREQYPLLGGPLTAALLKRSAAAVRNKAHRLGLQCPYDNESRRRSDAAHSKRLTGRQRPEQADIVRGLHAVGKMGNPSAETRAKISAISKARIAANGHPRGALGMQHSDATKRRIAEMSRAAWQSMTDEAKQQRTVRSMRRRAANGTMVQERPGASWKAAWREIGGVRKYYRSMWEANYARYLEWLKSLGTVAQWEHEPETFWFEGVRRGCVSYLPDFRVTFPSGMVEYHEVKGWMDARSVTKIRRMAKYHPSVRLIVVDAKAYRQLAKSVSRLVPGWEARK